MSEVKFSQNECNIKGSPKNLCCNMWRKKVLFYFWRNNYRSRKFYYHSFINWVGRENWNNVDPKIKNAWEEALSNFDKQNGIIKSLLKIESVKDILATEEPVEKDGEYIYEKFLKSSVSLVEKIDKIKNDFGKEKCQLLCEIIQSKLDDKGDGENNSWRILKKYLSDFPEEKTSYEKKELEKDVDLAKSINEIKKNDELKGIIKEILNSRDDKTSSLDVFGVTKKIINQ